MELHNFIRGWLTVTTITSLGNCFQCLTDDRFLTNKIYDLIYRPEVSLLYRRLFLLWQTFSVLLQIICIMYYDSGPLYAVTVFSFLIVFLHFTMETFLFRTASLNMGIMVNLAVSGLTVAFMTISWYWLRKPKLLKDEFKSQKFSRKRAKME